MGKDGKIRINKSDLADLMERLRESVVREVKYPSKPMSDFFMAKLN